MISGLNNKSRKKQIIIHGRKITYGERKKDTSCIYKEISTAKKAEKE